MKVQSDIQTLTCGGVTWFFRASLLVVAAASPSLAITYTTLDHPGSSSTILRGIDGNNIVGDYVSPGTRGFHFNGTTYTAVDDPLGRSTSAYGVSGSNIVGTYLAAPVSHGFLYNGSTYATIDPPGSTQSDAYGISGNKIVGDYVDASGTHGYLYNGSTYATLDPPASAATQAHGIAGNNIVGQYDNASGTHGFFYNGSTYTTLDDPLGTNGTYAFGISGSNIVGYFFDSSNVGHGFLYDGATYTTLDDPLGTGTFATSAFGMSGSKIVGSYSEVAAVYHGFVATVPEPGDYNGIVDVADYIVWRNGLGTTFTQQDYNVWRTHFGQTAGSGAGTTAKANVPEPFSLEICLCGLIIAAAVRSRKALLCTVTRDCDIKYHLFVIAAIAVAAMFVSSARADIFYVSAGFHDIDKITSAGAVSLFDITPSFPAGAYPVGLAFDGSGDLYAADPQKALIDKITAAGTVSLFATLPSGSFPAVLAFDGSSNLYVTLNGNEINKINPAGTVSHFATLPAGSDTAGLAFDSSGNLYAASDNFDQIYKVSPAGAAGLFVSLPVGSNPEGLAFDGNGNLYAAALGTDQIIKITSGGAVSLFATLLAGSLPAGLAFDGNGNLYETNRSGLIDRISPAGTVSPFATAAHDALYIAVTDDAGHPLAVPPPTLLGDYNRNGAVDAADYIAWRKGLGATFNQNDYDVWRSHFGQPSGSGAALPSAEPLSVAVPESATMTLAVIAFVVSAGFHCRGRLLHSRSQVPSRVLTWAAWLAIFLGGADTTLAFTTIFPGPPIVPFVGGFLRGTISGVNDAGTVIGVVPKVNDDRPYRWDGSGAAPVALGQTSATDVVGIDNTGTAVGVTNGSIPVYWPSSGTAPTNLAIPAGWSGAAALAINHTGTIVGFGGGASGLSAVRWTNSGATATELGTLGAFGADADYRAFGVNAVGIAVGQVTYNPTPADIGSRPIRWDAAGTATQLGDLGTYPASNIFDNVSKAYSINAAGTAVGQLLKNGGPALGYRAVRWDAGGVAATELGNLGTSASGAATDGARSINDAGMIAGSAEKYSPAGVLLGSRAVRWNSGQTAATELGNLGTDVSGKTTTDLGFARPMNAAGTIVGSAQKYDLAGNLLGNRAVYWGANATAEDLNSLVDPASGWVLTSASAISDTDWIAGNGLFDPDGAGGQAAYDRMFLLQLPPLVGDYNHNGVVDAADYVVWRKGLGQSGTGLAADGNNNGTIDTGDFDVWRAHFGQTAGSGAGATAGLLSSAVPEPATMTLLLMGFVIAGLSFPGRSPRNRHDREFTTPEELLPCVA